MANRRRGCYFCFQTLDPADKNERLLKFAQCRRCKALYHAICLHKAGRCLRCGSTKAKLVGIPPPPPARAVTKTQALTLHAAPRNRRKTLVIAALAIILVAGFAGCAGLSIFLLGTVDRQPDDVSGLQSALTGSTATPDGGSGAVPIHPSTTPATQSSTARPPSPTPVPSPVPSRTPTARPSPSPFPTATPIPLPTSTPVCQLDVARPFRGVWERQDLGCPTTSVTTIWAAWQPFERGNMLWREDTDRITVFFNDGSWLEFPDQWIEGMTIPTRGTAPAGTVAPARGFGYLWGTDDNVATRIGWALDQEKGFCADSQAFEAGFVFRSNDAVSCAGQSWNWAWDASFSPLFYRVYRNGSWIRDG